MKQSHRAALAVALVLLLVAAGAADLDAARVAEAGRVVDATTSFTVTATTTFSFAPDEFADLTPNTSIAVTFINGQPPSAPVDHTFTVLGCEGRQIPRGTTDVYPWLGNRKCSTDPLINLTATAGQHVNGTIPPQPGNTWFLFLCIEPGHYASGMYGYLAFGEAIPANISIGAPATGPGLAVFIIVGTIVSLTVLAIVLGFVVGRREGSQYEMPPERLGYPEPGSPPARPPEPPKQA